MNTTYTPPIVTRRDAIERDLIHYYTGEPCGRGHLAMRYTSTGNCCACKTNIKKAVDGRRVPKVIKLGYSKAAPLDDRRRAAEYIDACLASLNASMGYDVLTVMVNRRPDGTR
jgi:hypothetical protein